MPFAGTKGDASPAVDVWYAQAVATFGDTRLTRKVIRSEDMSKCALGVGVTSRPF